MWRCRTSPACDAGVYSAGVTSLKDNALLELCGSEERRSAFPAPAGGAGWTTRWRWQTCTGSGWMAGCRASTARWQGLEISGTIFAPLDEKGFVYLLEVSSEQGLQATIWGWKAGGKAWIWWSFRPARWRRSGESGRMSWTGSLVGEASCGLPLLAWGMQPDQEAELTLEGEHYRWEMPVRPESGPERPGGFLRLTQPGAGRGAHRGHCTCAGWAGSAC